MKRRKKRADPKEDTREIIKLKDFTDISSNSFDDYDNDELENNFLGGEPEEGSLFSFDDEEAERQEGEERLKKMRVPKALYWVGAILLALVLFLAVWVNRDRLSLDGFVEWVKLSVMGSGQGDGFPVAVTGSAVSAYNFTSQGGNACVLSDTALTVLSSSGRELLSLRHSLNRPALRTSGEKALLYNAGSAGYLTLSGTETVVEGSSEQEILTGAISAGGRFALGVQGSDGACELLVYQKNGDLQFRYLFAKDYITAIALNYDGTHGAVCTVAGDKGELLSKVTVFDFNQPEPLSSFETRDNLLLDAAWTEGGEIYAVGQSALLTAPSSTYQFTERNYEGRQLTAYSLSQGRAFVSVSAYEHAGPSTLLIYHGEEQPVRVESPVRIVSLSAFGGTVGALMGGEAVFFDFVTGGELGRIDAGSDAKGLALFSESAAYVLGVSEVRLLELESP